MIGEKIPGVIYIEKGKTGAKYYKQRRHILARGSVFCFLSATRYRRRLASLPRTLYTGNPEKNNVSIMINVLGHRAHRRMLKALADNGVKATFFRRQLGKQASRGAQEYTRRGARAGQPRLLPQRPQKALLRQEHRGDTDLRKIIETICGVKTAPLPLRARTTIPRSRPRRSWDTRP